MLVHSVPTLVEVGLKNGTMVDVALKLLEGQAVGLCPRVEAQGDP